VFQKQAGNAIETLALPTGPRSEKCKYAWDDGPEGSEGVIRAATQPQTPLGVQQNKARGACALIALSAAQAAARRR
jgi:hypothetical protein